MCSWAFVPIWQLCGSRIRLIGMNQEKRLSGPYPLALSIAGVLFLSGYAIMADDQAKCLTLSFAPLDDAVPDHPGQCFRLNAFHVVLTSPWGGRRITAVVGN